jgi:hypothetical protein
VIDIGGSMLRRLEAAEIESAATAPDAVDTELATAEKTTTTIRRFRFNTMLLSSSTAGCDRLLAGSGRSLDQD